MFLEGNDGRATGYHFHISAGRGRAQGNGWKQNPRGAWVLSTSGGNYTPEKIFYIDPTFTKVQGTKGLQFVRSGAAQGNTGSSSSAGNYRAGATLTLRADMNVRTGPGTSHRRKKRSELTADGRKHALSGTYAVLKQGTLSLIHILEENPTKEELAEWIRISGKPVKKFFNTSGMKYRELGLKDKLPQMSEEKQIELLASDGMLVKRPLLIDGEMVLTGFKEAEWPE